MVLRLYQSNVRAVDNTTVTLSARFDQFNLRHFYL